MAVPYPNEEFCTNCGSWVSPSRYDYETGWCIECSSPERPTCTTCGGLTDGHRSMCRTCRQEAWYEKHADELELLVVTKGYSVAYAVRVITKLVRPVCRKCRKPIKGGKPGESLFCKSNKACHAAYNKYRRLVKAGMPHEQAIREVVK